MPTTTNYGWTTPADTDLVKDGAAAIRTLGSSIDTTLKAQIDAQIPDSIVDAKGDLITATADNTPARLASSGVNGNVLTVDTSTATGLKWAAPAASAITWTQRLSATVNFKYIAHNGSNLYVAVGASGALYSSSDALTWTSRTSGFGANTINCVAFGGGIFVAVGNNGTITTSTDGITWTARTANMSTNTIWSVAHNGTEFIAVGNGGGATNTGGITYSSDGITWTRKSQTPTIGTSYHDIVWNGTNWIVVATSNTNNYLYSSSGAGTWTAGNAATAIDLYRIFWDGTRHIVAAVADQFNWWYSTSTTLGTLTETSGGNRVDLAAGHIGQAFYYNGKIYMSNGPYFASINSASADPLPSSAPILAPQLLTYTGGLSGTQNSTKVFVNATGIILACNNGIFTSF